MAEGRSRRRAGHPRLQYARGALAACAVAASLSIAAAAAGSGTVIPTGNLLQNPGAEAAPGSNGSGGPVPIPGWTTQTITGDSPTTQGFTVVAYGSPAFPIRRSPRRSAAAQTSSAAGTPRRSRKRRRPSMSLAPRRRSTRARRARSSRRTSAATTARPTRASSPQRFSVREATRSRPSQSAPSRKLTETARRRCCLAPPPPASRPGRGRSR